MNSATATLEVAADLAETIKANATARQQSLDEYLREMIEADKEGVSEVSAAENDEAHGLIEIALKENRFGKMSFRRLREKIIKLRQNISRKR